MAELSILELETRLNLQMCITKQFLYCQRQIVRSKDRAGVRQPLNHAGILRKNAYL